MGNKYQVVYDRLFDRRFDNTKFMQVVDKYEFELPEIGLDKCLREFLEKPVFTATSQFAVMDKLTGKKENLSGIKGLKNKCKYLTVMYLPDVVMRCIKAVLK